MKKVSKSDVATVKGGITFGTVGGWTIGGTTTGGFPPTGVKVTASRRC